MISLSIVSHGQFKLINNLLDDLEKYCINKIEFEVILTINIPESLPENFEKYHFTVKTIKNNLPKGFGANHNQAFQYAQYHYFCVLNPDIRLMSEPFTALIQELKNHSSIGAIAPKMINEKNSIEDNAREFLTPIRFLKRIFSRKKINFDFDQHQKIYPDWIAGMFMIFPAKVYKKMNGFDEKYFMYCEDMDICYRLKKLQYTVCLLTTITVIHCAQRESHRKLRYLIWHLDSLLKFFKKLSFP
jgi:N-acetylglucosaminyl-diphospho-decaprenol L-rhamnosyltransferase